MKHDRGYKGILSDKVEFWHFLKKYVGGSWVEGISLDSMEKINKSYVTNNHGYLDADVIYRQKRNGRDVYFYVLIELQSSVDYTMPFRLLKYMVALLDDVFKNTDEKVRNSSDFRLPAIVPIVLYNGGDNWTAVRTYREYTEDYKVFGNSIIDFSYILFDLKRMDDESILSTKKFLDVAFSLDKMYDEKISTEEYFKGLSSHLKKLAPELSREDKPKVAPWLLNRLDRLTKPEKEELIKLINQSLAKGEKDMDHAIDIMFDRIEERRAIAIAKKMIAKNRPVEEIAELTELDISKVLMLQSEMA